MSKNTIFSTGGSKSKRLEGVDREKKAVVWINWIDLRSCGAVALAFDSHWQQRDVHCLLAYLFGHWH